MCARTFMRPGPRAVIAGAAILLLSSIATTLPFGPGVRLAHAQPAPSALLLKRLAEAVDGHRTGAIVYLVASLQAPHDSIDIFEREADAIERARRAGPGFGLFGPYQSVRDPGARIGWIARCVHIDSVMDYCAGRPVFSVVDIDSVAITVRLRDGSRHVVPVPAGTDAMFFTLPAIDKFVIPYYTRVLGVEEAARMRQRFAANLNLP